MDRKVKWVVAAVLCVFGVPVMASAGGITTVPEDQGFGEQPVEAEARFSDDADIRGLVDQRGKHNPLADRNIAWSNGYIAPQGTVQLSTALLLNYRIAYSMRDDLRLFAQAAPQQFDQNFFALGGDFRVAEGDAWNLTVGTELRHRQTMLMPGTNQSGLGLSAVFDVVGHDRVSWSAGMTTNIALRQEAERQVALDCDNRRQVLEGCSEVVGEAKWMPPSGYWVAFHGGANVHVSENLVLNPEVFSGFSQGNFWLMDAWIRQPLEYQRELAVVEQTSWQVGLGPIGPVAGALGSTWRWRRLGMQGAVYLMALDGRVRLLPHFSFAMNFGGGR